MFKEVLWYYFNQTLFDERMQSWTQMKNINELVDEELTILFEHTKSVYDLVKMKEYLEIIKKICWIKNLSEYLIN